MAARIQSNRDQAHACRVLGEGAPESQSPGDVAEVSGHPGLFDDNDMGTRSGDPMGRGACTISGASTAPTQ